MERSEADALAPKIKKALAADPALTISDLAESLKADEADVQEVLETYLVKDGKPTYVGRTESGGAKGGDWITPPES